MAIEATRHPASFRDPSGFLFVRDGELYRQINRCYQDNYNRLIQSGLYQHLVSDGSLVRHQGVDLSLAESADACAVIEPEKIPFVSYPYEWCFSQLKDAALLTLKIQLSALGYGMSLKDASAYNIQFRCGKPVLIDTLSFETICEGRPWAAYHQFCQHFLAPLALMSHVDPRLGGLARVHLDGIPLDLASRLLPLRTWLVPSLLVHIHLHARAQRRYADQRVETKTRTIPKHSLLGLTDNLQSTVARMHVRKGAGHWADYYAESTYDTEAMQHKKELVNDFLAQVSPPPRTLWDLGANRGVFSLLAVARGIQTVSFDSDLECVERIYSEVAASDQQLLLPLWLDVTNPSPGAGWVHRERMSLMQRAPADTVMALALTHHLAIANNLAFQKLAAFFAAICRTLIIEFVPKNDPQVQRLLSTREDIFPDYTQEAFEKEFQKTFRILAKGLIRNTDRTLYLMDATTT